MIMQDFVTSVDRLTFGKANEEEFYIKECVGCGRDSNQIVKEDACTYIELEENSIELDCGFWYCHHDCYRDSR
jgi:Zn ribbon nucleic-acid-binding protein